MSAGYLQTVKAFQALGTAIREQFGPEAFYVLPRRAVVALEALRAKEQEQLRAQLMRVNAGNRRRQGRVRR